MSSKLLETLLNVVFGGVVARQLYYAWNACAVAVQEDLGDSGLNRYIHSIYYLSLSFYQQISLLSCLRT